MGMSAASSVSEAMKLCIFDLRRGQHEGQELDKILYFFPADLPFPTQLSVIGLSEGLITFTRFVAYCTHISALVSINELKFMRFFEKLLLKDGIPILVALIFIFLS